jgi:hypothetical protein
MKDQVQHQRDRARFVKLKLTFVVVEARIEARIWMLDIRTSNWKLPVHRTGLPGNEISFILRPLRGACRSNFLLRYQRRHP